ncbi:hypothetical protein CLOM_g15757 [Closterium sp. NIES-68]|nr:hypothetical protein CLOM_g15757 [Closterium sp. NIES-68]
MGARIRVLNVVAAVAIVVILYYVGRPLYWELEARLQEYREGFSDATAASTQTTAEGGNVQPVGNARGLEAASLQGLPKEASIALMALDVVDPDAATPAKPSAIANAAAGSAGAAEEEVGATADGSSQESSGTSGGGLDLPSEATAGAAATDATATGSPTTDSPGAGASGTGASGDQQFATGVRPILHEGRPLLPDLKREIWEKPPPGSAVPVREEFALRREMVQHRQRDNVVVVTFANYAFLDFVLNWVRHLTDLGVYNILVGAMDTKFLEALYWEGVPVFDLESGMTTDDPGWGTPVFHAMGREKVTLINVFLSLGVQLLICDTDTVWLRNPLPYMARYPQADVLTSSDHLTRSVEDESLEHWDRAQGAYNIGILHFRPTDPAKRFARAWAEQLAGDSKIWDQNGFNDLMRQKLGPDVNPEGNDNVFWAFDGTLKLGILPVALFCSGHTYFVQHLYRKIGLEPYAMHATFQFAGTEGKRHRFREAMAFIDPPEYYDPPGGVLSFVNNIPEELLTGGDHSLQTHFNLVNYQLTNLRSALAIATILNRTLVLPATWVRFDRIWFPHPGILDGTDTPQPFLSPLDHLVEVQRMLPGKLKEDEFGPAVPIREYSFLDNPRTPQALLKSKLSVELCDEGSPDCPLSPDPPTDKLRIKKNTRQNELKATLSRYSDSKWIEFSSMVDSFGGWDDKAMEKKFRWRLRQYVGIWCCVNAQPGHIWYDFFNDEIPGWKPRPPANWTEDHPPWGKDQPGAL